MKNIFILSLFLLIGSCGDGIDQISHTGICDGYSDWENSDFNLPWPSGQTYKVAQGNCSPLTHVGAHKYAYDIIMDTGSSITAARAGTVIEIEESFEDGNGCPNANFVKIEHTDGSVAAYFHLTNDGALVDKGDTINQGDPIGLSGNTGCSTDPHLHFVVFKDDSESSSIPVTFSNTSKNPRGLRRDSSYTAD